jgi:hypothetical protein
MSASHKPHGNSNIGAAVSSTLPLVGHDFSTVAPTFEMLTAPNVVIL